MSEMLERVARILEPQAWRALGLCDTLAYKNRRTSSLRKARAVIEALRPPSADTIQAVLAGFGDSGDVRHHNLGVFIEGLGYMVEAALPSPPAPEGDR